MSLKIADFGMSRDLLDESYYVSHAKKIPIKWTAPEVGYICTPQVRRACFEVVSAYRFLSNYIPGGIYIKNNMYT